MSTPRNALCPCGSGKKYKHCCALKTAQNAESIPQRPLFDRSTQILTLIAVLLAILVGAFKGVYAGFIVFAAEVAGIAIYLALRDPPPPHEEHETGLYTPEEAAALQAKAQAQYDRMLKDASKPRARGRMR